MDDYGYEMPVSQFLSRGCPVDFEEWADYLALGFSRDHVPELLRMATDRRLLEAHWKSSEYMAPMHAWRTLGQLRAADAVEPLFHALIETENEGLHEDLPKICGFLGASAVRPAAATLADEEAPIFVRATAGTCLSQIGLHHAAARSECVAALATQLEQYAAGEWEFNAFLIGDLRVLKAIEALPVIREAFDREIVADDIVDLRGVEVAFGLRELESPPPRRMSYLPRPHFSDSDKLPTTKVEKKKKKAKRKAVSKARKRSRRGR